MWSLRTIRPAMTAIRATNNEARRRFIKRLAYEQTVSFSVVAPRNRPFYRLRTDAIRGRRKFALFLGRASRRDHRVLGCGSLLPILPEPEASSTYSNSRHLTDDNGLPCWGTDFRRQV